MNLTGMLNYAACGILIVSMRNGHHQGKQMAHPATHIVYTLSEEDGIEGIGQQGVGSLKRGEEVVAAWATYDDRPHTDYQVEPLWATIAPLSEETQILAELWRAEGYSEANLAEAVCIAEAAKVAHS
ncbi:MAG: hypothetical protein QOJ65_1787 [Fimbriimonadaceae bacterium]|jgi:hypothetical protein|nr:hypothetical protein [Fimbriimonadaceae bacterium]